MSEFKSWDELTHKEQLECIVWDAYKDVYNFRPRHMNLQAMTEQQLEDELEKLQTMMKLMEAQAAEQQQQAISEFEKRVQNTIDTGAKNRETAIRWIRVAEDADCQDMDFLCYRLGLPFGYFKES
jgi:hypothetical protein